LSTDLASCHATSPKVPLVASGVCCCNRDRRKKSRISEPNKEVLEVGHPGPDKTHLPLSCKQYVQKRIMQVLESVVKPAGGKIPSRRRLYRGLEAALRMENIWHTAVLVINWRGITLGNGRGWLVGSG
jgi:hypothetical protein